LNSLPRWRSLRAGSGQARSSKMRRPGPHPSGPMSGRGAGPARLSRSVLSSETIPRFDLVADWSAPGTQGWAKSCGRARAEACPWHRKLAASSRSQSPPRSDSTSRQRGARAKPWPNPRPRFLRRMRRAKRNPSSRPRGRRRTLTPGVSAASCLCLRCMQRCSRIALALHPGYGAMPDGAFAPSGTFRG
jgi:hypothetical protein